MRVARRLVGTTLIAVCLTVVAGVATGGGSGVGFAQSGVTNSPSERPATANRLTDALQGERAAIRQTGPGERGEGGLLLLAALYGAVALTALAVTKIARGVRIAVYARQRVFTPARLRAPPTHQFA